MATQVDRLESRLSELEKKLAHYDRMLWVALGVGTIFGISGAFGLKVISEARAQIEDLQEDITGIDEVVRKAKQEVSEHSTSVVSKFQTEIEEKRATVLAGDVIPELKVRELSVLNSEDQTVVYLGVMDGEATVAVTEPSSDVLAAIRSDIFMVTDGKATSRMGVADATPYSSLMLNKELVWLASADEDGGVTEVRGVDGKRAVYLAAQDGGTGGYMRVGALDGSKGNIIAPSVSE